MQSLFDNTFDRSPIFYAKRVNFYSTKIIPGTKLYVFLFLPKFIFNSPY